MAPKRKPFGAATKQGTGRQYLMDNFSDASGDNLLNGHVLYIYYENEGSLSKTERVITSLKPLLTSIKYTVRKLVTNTLRKFNQLTRAKRFERFQVMCNQSFGVIQPCRSRLAAQTRPGSSSSQLAPSSRAETSSQLATPSSEPATPFSRSGTPSATGPTACSKCAVLRARLAKAIQHRRHDWEMHRRQVTKLQNKIVSSKSQTIVKVLNQKLNRKDEQLLKLKAELKRGPAVDELAKTRILLRNAQRQLNGLKMSRSTVTHIDAAEMRDSVSLTREVEGETLTPEDHVTVDPVVQSVQPGQEFGPDDGIVNPVPTANNPVPNTQLSS